MTTTACTQQASDPAPVGETATATPQPEAQGRAAIVFYSRAGENYWHGGRRDLDVGNTHRVAEFIAARVDADVIRIDAADPYPHSYDPTVERNRREQQDDARPRIAGGTPDLSGYSTIILGSPVWNTRAPMIIRTLLDGTDLTGVTLHPFLTYAVGEGRVFRDYAELDPAATVTPGLAIHGEYAADSAPQVDEWIATNGLGGLGGARSTDTPTP